MISCSSYEGIHCFLSRSSSKSSLMCGTLSKSSCLTVGCTVGFAVSVVTGRLNEGDDGFGCASGWPVRKGLCSCSIWFGEKGSAGANGEVASWQIGLADFGAAVIFHGGVREVMGFILMEHSNGKIWLGMYIYKVWRTFCVARRRGSCVLIKSGRSEKPKPNIKQIESFELLHIALWGFEIVKNLDWALSVVTFSRLSFHLIIHYSSTVVRPGAPIQRCWWHLSRGLFVVNHSWYSCYGISLGFGGWSGQRQSSRPIWPISRILQTMRLYVAPLLSQQPRLWLLEARSQESCNVCGAMPPTSATLR